MAASSPVLQRLAMIVPALFLIFSLFPPHSFAEEKTVSEWTLSLYGNYDGKFDLSSSDVSLFSLENVVPGDSFHGKIHVKNNTEEKMDISIFTITSNLEDRTLYNALDLKITEGEDLVYEGAYGDAKAPISKYNSIAPGEKLTYDVTISLPGTVGNEAIGKEMDSTWTFEARYHGEDIVPPGNNDNEKPETDINDGNGGDIGNDAGLGSGANTGNKTDADKNNEANTEEKQEYSYIVNYLDKDGNKLIPSKKGTAKYREKITEKAEKIKGYTPDKAEKSILIEKGDNVITFTYNKTVKTGVDLTESNTVSGMWLFVGGLCVVGAAVVYMRIRSAKQEANALNASSSFKEADHHNEK